MAGLTPCDATPHANSVYPSGVDLAANSAPRLPAAPERFSITTCWPSPSVSLEPTMRLTMSTAPPGGNGTMMRTGRLGYACVEPVEAAYAAQLAAATRLDARAIAPTVQFVFMTPPFTVLIHAETKNIGRAIEQIHA